jgi:hypothetical protein
MAAGIADLSVHHAPSRFKPVDPHRSLQGTGPAKIKLLKFREIGYLPGQRGEWIAPEIDLTQFDQTANRFRECGEFVVSQMQLP